MGKTKAGAYKADQENSPEEAAIKIMQQHNKYLGGEPPISIWITSLWPW
ncbi:hypothetical protein J7E73_28990 [Paenibacillus albidus]|nr:hypothetical protein [Paenibacillus albidus]